MTNKYKFMVAIFAIILVFGASAFGQAKVYRNNEQIDVTTTNPFGISGGPCWEAVMFTSGFVQNNFQTVQLPNGGFQVTWSTVIHLDNGVGVVSGMAYGVKENFQYVFHFQKGQYVLPQRLFFRLTQTATRKMFMVSQASVLLYDLDTNTTKVMVDKYEVNCP